MAEECHDQDERTRFDLAIRKIDEANAQDPHTVSVDGASRPRELVYSEWVSGWIDRLRPDAPIALRLAARCQHIRRWEVPRNSYEMNRAGYLKWREDLKKFHAEKAGEILRGAGFSDGVIARVRELNLKRQLASNPDCQTLEDALCLVTLEHQLAELMEKLEEEKLVDVLRKTWKKMSEQGRNAALGLAYSARERALLEKALAPAP